jgi:hypothetical protein
VVVWIWFFRDHPPQPKKVTSQELPKRREVSDEARLRTPFWRLFCRMLPLIITDFCYGWTLWVCLNWLPLFFRQNYGLSLESSSLFISAIFLAGIFGDTLGGVVSDRILRIRVAS